MYIISFVLSIALFIFLLIMNSVVEMGAIVVAIFAPLCIIVFPIEICGFFLNWKKILIGFIAPIPVLSYIFQFFIGTWYAIKALIAIFKHQDLTLGKSDNEDDQ